MLKHTLLCACCAEVSEKTIFCAAVSETVFASKVANRLSNSILSSLSVKADEDIGENGGDNFKDDELAIAALLAALMWQRGKQFKGPLFDLLATQNADVGKIDDALVAFETDMGGKLTKAEIKDFRLMIDNLLNTGAREISNGVIDKVSFNTASDALWLRLEESVENFARRFITPAVRKGIENIRANTPGLEPHVYSDVQLLIDSRLQGTGYWDIVANSTASRGYHYGMLKAAQAQSFKTYMFVAVLDDRTTPICRAMNGKIFKVADAVNIMEEAFAADDLETYKDIMPWVTNDDGVAEADPSVLTQAGILVPPLHALCRSTIRVL